jgi:hypothetical protein
MAVLYIQYEWTRIPEDRRSVDYELSDVTALERCLYQFLCVYTGTFTISIDDLQLTLDLRPDIYTVFEDLPAALETLAGAPGIEADLYFYEQGSDFHIYLARVDQFIQMRFTKESEVGSKYAHMSEHPFVIPIQQGITPWAHLLQAVLDEVVTLCPELQNEVSYLMYRQRLDDLVQELRMLT